MFLVIKEIFGMRGEDDRDKVKQYKEEDLDVILKEVFKEFDSTNEDAYYVEGPDPEDPSDEGTMEYDISKLSGEELKEKCMECYENFLVEDYNITIYEIEAGQEEMCVVFDTIQYGEY